MTHVRHVLEALALMLAFGLLGALSPEAASNLGGFLGRTLGPRLPVTHRARRNLRLAFPEKSGVELTRILRGMWDNLGRVVAEYPHLGRITAPGSDRVTLGDVAPVLALRDQRKAGIVASAHLANWEILPVMAARHGVGMTAIVREPNNPLVRPLIDRLRGVAGGQLTPKGRTGARQAIDVLRRGHVLGLLFDQKLSRGFSVPLFGIEAMTSAAPAQLALRFGCPLVPVRVERTGPARFRVTAHPPIELPTTGDRQADAIQITRELNRILEAWIRERPEQWLWLHRRWPAAAYHRLEANSRSDHALSA